MLTPAINYQSELNNIFNSIWNDEYYKYYFCEGYYSGIDICKETWNRHQFVSVSSSNVVNGFISYYIDRHTYGCYNLSIIGFYKDKNVTFGNDVSRAIRDIFEKYRFNKLSFTVVIGNPIEKTYDKLMKKYGGRVVGIKEKEVKLIDGKFYDLKIYEIMRDNYIESCK